MLEKSEITPEEITIWYRSISAKYQSLADSIKATIVSLLGTKAIDFVAVTSRVKSLESVLEKFSRKSYATTEEITDLLGIRVVLYLESDIAKISAVINSAFKSFPDLGVDKSEELAVDQIGYRSVHYICELGEQRIRLDELAQYSGVKFEIQVRTILQHAWAEIEHDRIYKFPGELPPGHRRRLNLLAGTLELVDREFSTIVKELDEHKKSGQKSVINSKANGTALDVEVLSAFLKEPKIRELIGDKFANESVAGAIDELEKFGVSDLTQLKAIVSDAFIDALNGNTQRTSKIGILRKAMMYNNLEKYFSQAWPRTWRGLSKSSEKMLTEKYGKDRVDKINKTYLNDKQNK